MVAMLAYANADLGFRSNTKTAMQVPDSVPLPLQSSNHDYKSTPQSSINSTSKGIQLHFKDYPLGELLKNIHDETGIRFKLSPQMATVPISINVEAKNWKSSVRKLIAEYSRIEVWTNQRKNSRIWLMKSTPHN